jgi:type I restriction enzyme M protein
VDLSALRAKAAAEALPLRDAARAKQREADETRDGLKALKKAKPRDDAAIAAMEAAIRELLKAAREATNKADDVENAVYDLKAVNPNRQVESDRRTPEELLDLVEEKGVAIADALKTLRALLEHAPATTQST